MSDPKRIVGPRGALNDQIRRQMGRTIPSPEVKPPGTKVLNDATRTKAGR
jgi:hypothetical protein